VRDALGELIGAAKDGLLAMSVGVGLGVLHELLEAEVGEVVGPKGKHIPERTAVRHGHEDGEVTLGGRRVPVSRPRARAADGEHEVELVTYGHFAARDQLTAVVLERMLAGVSTRRYARTGEPVGAGVDEVARSMSKSAVSREFVSRTREHLIELMSRPLGRSAARGADAGRHRAQGPLLRGRAENRHRRRQASTRAVGRLDRGRHRRHHAAEQPRRARPGCRAGRARRHRRRQGAAQGRPATCSASTPRCNAANATKERNVLGHLPERDRPLVRRRLRAAWALDDHDRALDQLRALTDELARSHPGAAASLREGMEETLTVTRLGVRGRLKRTLASTNPCESMIETVRRISRNVKHWSSGDMCLRWTAAGMLEAQTHFRRVIGHSDLAKVALAVERDVAAKHAAACQAASR
jgi:putative transposase